MRKYVLALSLLWVASSSAQVLVSYDKSSGADFTAYKTFQVFSLDVKSDPDLEPRREGLNLLITEINKQMEMRGYEKVKENPDLKINIGVVISKKKQTRETSIREAPRYIGQRNYHWESQEVVVGTYVGGTVVLDIVDTQSDEMVWQAVSKGVLDEKKPEKNKKKIVKGVEKLFKKYPVKAK